MNIGRMNKKVVMEYPYNVSDGKGGQTRTWRKKADVWALIEPLSGKEYFQAAETQPEIVAKITIRYRDDVIASWRVNYNETYYYIDAVIDPELSHEYLMLMCKNKDI